MEGRILGQWRPVALVLDMNRLGEILQVLVRHGFSPIVSRLRRGGADLARAVSGLTPSGEADMATQSLPERIRLVFQDLGPTFIKLGQILSTRSDLIPDEIATELQKLQDTVPAVDFADIRTVIEADLGKPLPELFAQLEEEPLGTASIGQVHGARLHDGTDVVVKVQRPGVRRLIERDLHLLAEMAERVTALWSELRIYDLPAIVDQFRQALMRELDYTHERRSAQRFASAFRDHPHIVVPRVYPARSSQRVLTMQRIRGVKITEASSLGNDPKLLARTAVEAVLTMVFEHGFFHADPHPGNIFSLPENRIAFLDLGMVGRLTDTMRFRLTDLIIALVENDIDAAARALAALGKREVPLDRARFLADVGEIMDLVVGLPIEEIQLSEVIRELFNGARRHRIRIPPECFLMGKAMLTIETVAHGLDPDLDIEGAVTPHIRRLLALRLAPKRLGKLVWQRLSETADAAGELPGQITDLLESLQRGTLTLRVEPAHQHRTMAVIEQLVQKLTFALIIAALVLSSAVFITFSGFQWLVWGIPAPLFFGFGGYIAAIILAIALVRQANRPNGGGDSPS
ncbi:MAG TPA: AarF/ABC1/UbiB kinase family protein [Candidatus Ozemobacteraceae bacterium]|nr:AarF/ABC1/UbiB kinase family protein [Candidatus Ozemobacteraceae bacterium]